MAPYAIGHLKMSYILEEKGIHLKEDERLKLYITNTLEMEDIEQINLPFMSTLAEESRKAGEIKKNTPILVILGNPPYSGHSLTQSETVISIHTQTSRIKYKKIKTWIGEQVEVYKRVEGKMLPDRNLKWLQDDYVKFIRFSQWKIDQNGEGVLGFITNHGYLDNPTFRGMRQSLLKSFNEIYILDLHGNARKKEKCPDGSKDENVFDIMQGVAIALFIKKKNDDSPCKIFHSELWGLREDKYDILAENDLHSIEWKEIYPKSGFYFFVPRDEELDKIYLKFFNISEIFPLNGVGMTTARDEFVIDNDKSALLKRIILFKNHKGPDDVLHEIFNINRKKGWSIRKAWNMLQSLNDDEIEPLIKPVLYRPFDVKWIFYHDSLVWRTAKRVMEDMFKKNIGLIFHKREELQISYSHFLISSNIVEHGCLSSKTTCYLSPFYIHNGIEGLYKNDWENAIDYNLDKKITKIVFKGLKDPGIKPEAIFYYVYAVVYSTYYREKYSEYLRMDFPRIPFTSDYELFLEMEKLGHNLADLHLMTSPLLNQTFSRFEIAGDNIIKKVAYNEEEKRVYIDDNQYFSNIDQDIWEYQIGGYQVMGKWLKDRKKRVLSLPEIEHYIKIARALQLTIQYQEKIDELYPGIEENLIS
jgi:predicted helicase